MSDVTPDGADQSPSAASSNDSSDTRPIDLTETTPAESVSSGVAADERPWTLKAVLTACLASLLVGGVLGASLGVLVAQHRSDDRPAVMRHSRQLDSGRVSPDDRQSRRQSPWTSPRREQRSDGDSDRAPLFGGSQGFQLDPQMRDFILEMLRGLGTQFLEQMQQRAQGGNGTDQSTKPNPGTTPDNGRADTGKNG